MSEPMTGEVVLMDDEVKSTLQSLDTPSNEIAISQMLDKAKSYLEVAMRQADAPRAIADFKAEIIAVAQYAKQKKVSEEIQIDATAMVRRAERSLGVAIREGQEHGRVATSPEMKRKAGLVAAAKKRGDGQLHDKELMEKPTPADFVSRHDLTANGAGIYHMTDDVTDSEFDNALESAKEERNLSRANVVRKIKASKSEEPSGEEVPEPSGPGSTLPEEIRERVEELASQGVSSRNIGAELGIDKSTVTRMLNGRTKPVKGNNTQKIMERLTESLWGMRQSLQTITAVDSGLNPDQVAAWSKELRSTSAELNRIKNLLKESK